MADEISSSNKRTLDDFTEPDAKRARFDENNEVSHENTGSTSDSKDLGFGGVNDVKTDPSKGFDKILNAPSDPSDNSSPVENQSSPPKISSPNANNNSEFSPTSQHIGSTVPLSNNFSTSGDYQPISPNENSSPTSMAPNSSNPNRFNSPPVGSNTTNQAHSPSVSGNNNVPISLTPDEQRFMKFGEELFAGRYSEAYQILIGFLAKNFYYWGSLLLLYRYYPLIVAQNMSKLDIDPTKTTLVQLHSIILPYFDDSSVDSLNKLITGYNSPSAKGLLALCYLFVATPGKGPDAEAVYELKISKGLQLLNQLASLRNPLALTTLGWFSESGMYVTKNVSKSIEFYQQAAAMDFSEAQYQMGVIYDTGDHRDPLRAIEYYHLAAKQGNPEALYNLGVSYQSGDNSELDLNKAVEFYSQAADQGHSKAQCNLGVCYEMEIGVPKDLSRAVYYYDLAAKQGNSEALCNLGVCYQDGDGVPVNLEKAREYYQMAANQGNAEAQFNLGELYYNGEGVQQNIQKAVALYLLAAGSGNANAQFKLGLCYYNGTPGFSVDKAQGVDLITLASDQDHPDAIAWLKRL